MRRSRRISVTQRHGVCRRVITLLLSGLFALTTSTTSQAQNAPAVEQSLEQHVSVAIADASRRFGIPESWIRAVLATESAHDFRAVSKKRAMGLMQVMPATWDELTARLELGDDPFDPHDNILAGTAYLREMLDRYGDVTSMLAAYNAGPTRYDEYLTLGTPLPAETVDYVATLAPIMGGTPLPGAMQTSPHPADWREAPLFVVAGKGAALATPPQFDGDSAAIDPPVLSHAESVTSAASDSLFVTSSAGILAP